MKKKTSTMFLLFAGLFLLINKQMIAQPDQIIMQIRKDYAETMELLDANALEMISQQYYCDELEIQITCYFQGDDIRMIEHSSGHEHGWQNKQIFFKNGKAYFAFETSGVWYFGGPESTDVNVTNTIDEIWETRSYLDKGKVYKKLVKNYKIESWKPAPDASKIPNEKSTEGVGAPYPYEDYFQYWINGKEKC